MVGFFSTLLLFYLCTKLNSIHLQLSVFYIDNQTHSLFNVVLNNPKTNIVPSTLSILSIYNFELKLVGINLHGCTCKCFPVICSSHH